jgi:hypothetical protein
MYHISVEKKLQGRFSSDRQPQIHITDFEGMQGMPLLGK